MRSRCWRWFATGWKRKPEEERGTEVPRTLLPLREFGSGTRPYSMDYITQWLSHRYDTVYTCYNWYSITFHSFLALIAVIGLIGAIRRRDRALIGLLTGLLLLFVGDPVRSFCDMLLVPRPSPNISFSETVAAQRPLIVLGSVDRNILKPAGFALALVSACALLRSGRARKPSTRPRTIEAEPEQPNP